MFSFFYYIVQIGAMIDLNMIGDIPWWFSVELFQDQRPIFLVCLVRKLEHPSSFTLQCWIILFFHIHRCNWVIILLYLQLYNLELISLNRGPGWSRYFRGVLQWSPMEQIVRAMADAFHPRERGPPLVFGLRRFQRYL
jgi:hypothetical protein